MRIRYQCQFNYCTSVCTRGTQHRDLVVSVDWHINGVYLNRRINYKRSMNVNTPQICCWGFFFLSWSSSIVGVSGAGPATVTAFNTGTNANTSDVESKGASHLSLSLEKQKVLVLLLVLVLGLLMVVEVLVLVHAVAPINAITSPRYCRWSVSEGSTWTSARKC